MTRLIRKLVLAAVLAALAQTTAGGAAMAQSPVTFVSPTGT